MRTETDRLGEADLATLRAEQFGAAALAAAMARAGAREATPGRCLNCAARITPPAIYCDDECREDHEARDKIARRKGGR